MHVFKGWVLLLQATASMECNAVANQMHSMMLLAFPGT